MDSLNEQSTSSTGVLLSDVIDEVVPMTPTDTSSDNTTGDVDNFKKYVENSLEDLQLSEETDMSVYNFEDNYSTTDGGGRSLRRRTSRPDFKNFLENFDPGNSEREIRKRKKKQAHHSKYKKYIFHLYFLVFESIPQHKCSSN